MTPTPENHHALADTAAYARELKEAGIDDDVVDVAGYGFIRGRMVDGKNLFMGARALQREPGIDLNSQECMFAVTVVFRAAGFTVLDPPP